jgi:hypothetical protein
MRQPLLVPQIRRSITHMSLDRKRDSMTKKITTTEDLVIEVEATIKEFRTQYEAWQAHQAVSDSMLYALLESCLDFYYFLRSNEDYESAFKSTCHFKWNTKTKLHALIVKAVFGDKNKKNYAYIKAIKVAIDEGIKSEENKMQTWLRMNGGINGVIRTEEEPRVNVEREHYIDVGRNCELYGIKPKLKPFVNEELANSIESGEIILLVNINKSTSEISIKSFSLEKDLIDKIYYDFGKNLVSKSKKYKENKDKAEKIMLEKKEKAAKEVSSKLKDMRGKYNVKAKTKNESDVAA